MKQSRPAVTDAQRCVFRNLAQRLPAATGLYGMSRMGGLDRTLGAMRRRGWITAQNRLTKLGKIVCEQLDGPGRILPTEEVRQMMRDAAPGSALLNRRRTRGAVRRRRP